MFIFTSSSDSIQNDGAVTKALMTGSRRGRRSASRIKKNNFEKTCAMQDDESGGEKEETKDKVCSE